MNGQELREFILKADDLKKQKIHIDEWNCDLWVRQLTGKQLDEWEKSGADIIGLRAKIVSFCVVDDDGNRVFSDKDIEKLSNKCGAALNKIVDACSKLNLITQKDIEAIAKNS